MKILRISSYIIILFLLFLIFREKSPKPPKPKTIIIKNTAKSIIKPTENKTKDEVTTEEEYQNILTPSELCRQNFNYIPFKLCLRIHAECQKKYFKKKTISHCDDLNEEDKETCEHEDFLAEHYRSQDFIESCLDDFENSEIFKANKIKL